MPGKPCYNTKVCVCMHYFWEMIGESRMDRYDPDWEQEDRGRNTGAYRDERERRRRRNSRRAQRERELRRKKRIALVVLGAVAAALILIVILIAGGRKQKESAASAASSAETIPAEETAGTAETAEAAGTDPAAQEPADAPYVFTETENTVQLGKSLTDISIYNDQRHITADSSAGSTEGAAGTDPADAGTGDEQSEDGSGTGSSAMTAEEAAKAPDYVDSQYAILVNTDTGEILAERNAFDRIVPASMTKVMTVLVAVEHMQNPEENLKDKVTITQEICDESYRSGSSFVGYGVGDQASVEDLLYGAILPSGADAAMALAEYTAGSQEAFADMMNEKAQELGIADTTHFTNCVGLYDENHYSTVYDMAVIMRAAIDNELCKKVLSTHTWTTGATMDHPEGIQISNWFLRRIEDHDTNGTVVCGKTGFVNESGNCAVSYQEGNSGTGYIACTALTYNQWRSIYDHIALYKTYTK